MVSSTSDAVSRTLGLDALRNNILAAKTVSDILKTTLGPKGMDKLLMGRDGTIVVTNDGATILEHLSLDHPAATMLVDVAKTQEREIGDGTTTVTVLAGTLLAEALELLEKKIHPTVIISGYRTALRYALSVIGNSTFSFDNQESILRQVALTAMTGKEAEGNKEALADLVLSALSFVKQGRIIRREDIRIEKIREESSAHSELVQGVVFPGGRAHSDMPLSIDAARILLIDASLDVRLPDTTAQLSLSGPDQLEQLLSQEEQYLKEVAERIIRSGANVVLCNKGIDDVIQYHLARAGIFACRRVSQQDFSFISRATGARRVATVNEIRSDSLGRARRVSEFGNGEESYVSIEGCTNPHAVTLVLRGSSEQLLDEMQRAVEDCIGDLATVLRSESVVAGGGAVEIELARRLRMHARSVGGREQLAIEKFAHALESIPEALAENAGLDSITVLAELRRQHEEKMLYSGLNLLSGSIENTRVAGILEPLDLKLQALSAATEYATMILRIDDVFLSTQEKIKNEPTLDS